MSYIPRISIQSALTSPWVRGGSVVTAIALGAITYLGHCDYSRFLKALNVKKMPGSQSWHAQILDLFKRGLSVLRTQSFIPDSWGQIDLTSLSTKDLELFIQSTPHFSKAQVRQLRGITNIDPKTRSKLYESFITAQAKLNPSEDRLINELRELILNKPKGPGRIWLNFALLAKAWALHNKYPDWSGQWGDLEMVTKAYMPSLDVRSLNQFSIFPRTHDSATQTKSYYFIDLSLLKWLSDAQVQSLSFEFLNFETCVIDENGGSSFHPSSPLQLREAIVPLFPRLTPEQQTVLKKRTFKTMGLKEIQSTTDD